MPARPLNPLLLLLLTLLLLPSAQAAKQGMKAIDPRIVAPKLEMTDMDGEPRSLKSLRGKVVIVNFWATWCPPCRAELPSMNRAWARLDPERFAMLAVNVGEDEDTIFSFMGDYPIEFPVWLDQSGKAAREWPLRGLPTTYVIDKKGRIAYRAIGGREWDDEALLEKIRALAEE
jgi:thiol-disulfide isomerase/thioredoxin